MLTKQTKKKNVKIQKFKILKNRNKRSKDLGALLDRCSWGDIGKFSADLYQKLAAAD